MNHHRVALTIGAALIGALTGYLQGGVTSAVLLAIGGAAWALLYQQLRSRG